jgi:hypothetical protein
MYGNVVRCQMLHLGEINGASLNERGFVTVSMRELGRVKILVADLFSRMSCERTSIIPCQPENAGESQRRLGPRHQSRTLASIT